MIENQIMKEFVLNVLLKIVNNVDEYMYIKCVKQDFILMNKMNVSTIPND